MRFLNYLKYRLLFIFILVCSTSVVASDIDSLLLQSRRYIADSVKQAFNMQTATEEQKMDYYMTVSARYNDWDLDSSIIYIEKGLAIAQKLKDYEKITAFYIGLGVAHGFKGNYDTALYYLEQTNELAVNHGDKRNEASAIKLIGFVYSQQGKFNLAIDYHLKYVKICETEGWTHENGYISALANLSEYYRRLGSTDMAIFYLKKAEKVCNDYRNKYFISAYMDSQVWNEFAFNFLKKNDLDEALRYAMKSDSIIDGIGIINACMTKGLLSSIYLRKSDSKLALKYANESYQYADVLKDVGLYAYARKIRSDVYLAQKRYIEAEIEAFKVWAADSTNVDESRAAVENIVMANIFMTNTEKAAYYLKKYSELNAQYSEKSFHTTVSDLSIKYETEKKDMQIKEFEKKRKLYILIIGISVVAVLMVLAMLYFRQRLNKQKIKQLEQEKQLIASQAIIDGEAAERTRLARDLHDGLGGMLSVVKLNLKDMSGFSMIENLDVGNFRRAVEMLDKSIVELRRVSHHIMPDLSGGLKTPLEDFCRSIPEAHFRFFGDDSHLDNRLKITVYRCAHELVNNAIKHARATAINIQLMIEDNFISLSVQDDGIGFAPEKVVNGLGLENIHARVAMYNGKVNIYSSPEKGGTEVNIEIELK